MEWLIIKRKDEMPVVIPGIAILGVRYNHCCLDQQVDLTVILCYSLSNDRRRYFHENTGNSLEETG